MALVAVAEVLHHVGRPLVGLGEQHAVGVVRVDHLAHPLQERVGLGQVLAVRAVAFEEVRHRVETEAVEPKVEPEPDHVDHASRTSGLSKFRSGWWEKKRCQ